MMRARLGAGHHIEAAFDGDNANAMDDGRDSVMATGLRLVIVVGCVIAAAVLVAGPGGALAGLPAVGRGLVPSDVDGANLAAVFLVSAGVATIVARGAPVVGSLAIGLGLAWIVASASASPTVLPLVRPIAVGAASMLAVLVCALAVAIDPGRVPRNVRRIVTVLVLAGAAVAVARMASYSPFFDPACPASCVRTDPILDLSPSAQIELARVARLLGLGCGIAAVLIGSWSALSGPLLHGSRRLAKGGIVLAGAGLGGASALALAGRQPRALAGPDDTGVALVAALGIAGMVTLAGGLWWSVARLVRLRTRIRRLAADVAAAPDESTVERRLARALRDPTYRDRLCHRGRRRLCRWRWGTL